MASDQRILHLVTAHWLTLLPESHACDSPAGQSGGEPRIVSGLVRLVASRPPLTASSSKGGAMGPALATLALGVILVMASAVVLVLVRL